MPYKEPKNRRLAEKRYLARLSPEKKERRAHLQSLRAKEYWAALSPEAKHAINQKRITNKRRAYATDPVVRSRLHLDAKNRYHALRLRALEKLGKRCANPNCVWLNEDGTLGCTDPVCLQIDHVNGDGYKELRGQMSGYTFLKKALADTNGNYQCLCANCNWIKRWENQEFSTGRKLSTYRPALEPPASSPNSAPASVPSA
jgi:hypothetical protein